MDAAPNRWGLTMEVSPRQEGRDLGGVRDPGCISLSTSFPLEWTGPTPSKKGSQRDIGSNFLPPGSGWPSTGPLVFQSLMPPPSLPLGKQDVLLAVR